MKYRTITISFYDCNAEINFVSDEIHAKMTHKTELWLKENSNVGRK